MTSGGCLAINPPPPSAMDHVQQQESTNGRRYQASAGNQRPPAHTRVITDEGVDTEESDRSRRTSSYGSDSSLGSSFTSSSASRSAAGEASAQQAMRRTASTPQQLNASPRVLTVSGVAMLGMPSTAIVRRRPLHETLNEDSEDNFEVALTWHRNNRILLGRLVDAAPKGKLSLINLCRRGIGPKEALLLREAIISNQQLSVVRLSYNDLRDEGTTSIAEAVSANGRHHASLSTLDLGFNSIGDQGCEAISVHALAGNYVLGTLYLSGNRVRDKGAISIAGAILHGSALSELHLTANSIKSIGLKALAGAIAQADVKMRQEQLMQNGLPIRRKSLTKLYLGCTEFDESGFVAVPGMLLTNTSLQSLCLTSNNINDQGVALLSQALTHNKALPLETLELSFNEITDQGLECLMNAIWGSQTLKHLKLDNNRLKDRGAQLCAVVLTSVPLRLLDVSCNTITTVGIKALMKNVSDSESLESFGMSGIPVDQNGSKAISYALAYNSSLSVLRMDNCSAGYSAQRHIVAGMVSNCRGSMRVFTGFDIAPIAMTLGMPRLPESWSNEQVLGFVRLMWQQWLFKSSRGNPQDVATIAKGPAPPAAVATAAKIAFTALGNNPENLFFSEEYSRPVIEASPIDSTKSALLERSGSGTLSPPSDAMETPEEMLHEWFEGDTKPQLGAGPVSALLRSPLEDSEKRNRNLQWLRLHFRPLSQIGRLPFNNADLWQLHQYYFSPPSADVEADSVDEANQGKTGSLEPGKRPDGDASENGGGMSRAASIRSIHEALSACASEDAPTSKRRTHDELEGGQEPATKKAKSLKPRLAYYPRVTAKMQTLGAKPTEHMLGLLRQLKYTENAMFGGNDPYDDTHRCSDMRSDVEMILLDLF